ncbi:MAG: Zn-dependent exopeptidase M28 [Candidatus Cloacimonetes bacterium]|nr:Zn-dependent exopeptidase M28 [Candidatus Cloacimonadota bacterium]MCF7883537.1 Zn-dependent exopeptidase M28 [Candidatus Cloacimonadota bacterium]
MINPYKVVKELNFERLAGSANEKKAIEILSNHIKELGLKPQLEAFKLVSFDAGEATISVNGKSFPAIPYGLNENVKLKGELCVLENLDILDYNKGAYKDKIVLCYGFSRGMAPKLKAAGVKAYIGMGRPHRAATSLSHRQTSHKEGYVNSVTISHDNAIKLRRFDGKEIAIAIKQKVEKRSAKNIVVDIPGKGFDENLTIACGHYDTVAHSVGASDNSGGTVTLLKILEYFVKHQPQRDLRVIFFSGEELGLLGSQAYVEQHLEEIKDRLKLVVNIDVSGDAIGHDHFNVIGSKEFMGYTDGITKEIGMLFKSAIDIFSSDSMPFAPYEIPSVNVFREGGKATVMIHTPADSVKNVGPRGYDTTIKASINLLDRVMNAKVYPVKKEIDESLREKIEKYIYNLHYKKPELEWTPKYKK